MRKLLIVAVCGVVLGAAGVLLAQQQYPNLPDAPIMLDNDSVVVQKMEFTPGQWAGEHSHLGRQLVVILKPTKMLYKEGGEETERSFKTGDVFWVDAVTHDHKALSKGTALMISLK